MKIDYRRATPVEPSSERHEKPQLHLDRGYRDDFA